MYLNICAKGSFDVYSYFIPFDIKSFALRGLKRRYIFPFLMKKEVSFQADQLIMIES